MSFRVYTEMPKVLLKQFLQRFRVVSLFERPGTLLCVRRVANA